MASAYQTFDEEGLDTALATAESMAPAIKVESGGERTPPKPTESLTAAEQVRGPTPSEPTEEEKIVLQIRRRLGMREAARLSESRAVKQLLDMKARVTPGDEAKSSIPGMAPRRLPTANDRGASRR
jgi:hypothetical protein